MNNDTVSLPAAVPLHQHYENMYNQALQADQPQASTSASVASISSAAATTPVPAAESVSANAKMRRRLPPQALAMIREWYSTNPDHAPDDRREMVQRIHKLFPGNLWYTYQTLTSWVQNRRQAERRQAEKRAEKKDTASILWPSLTRENIDTLRILRQQRPENLALEKSVQIWAEALGVPKKEIDAWILYNPEESKENAASPQERKPALHLPTPETTASPEPSHSHVSQSPTTPSHPVFMQMPPFSVMQPIVKQQPYSPVQGQFVPVMFSPPGAPPQQYPPNDPRYITLPHFGAPVPHAPQAGFQPVQQQPPILPPFSQSPVQAQPKLRVQTATAQAPQASRSPQTSTPTPAPAPTLHQHLLKTFATTVNELDLSLPPPVPVTGREDFDKKFEPWAQKMRELLGKAKAGTYTSVDLPMDMPQLDLPEVADPEEWTIDIDPR